jgi:phage gpG-like protein
MTGELQESLARDHGEHVLEATTDSVVEGTSDDKAAYHQYGTDTIPARPIYVDPDDDTIAKMRAAIVEGIAASI